MIFFIDYLLSRKAICLIFMALEHLLLVNPGFPLVYFPASAYGNEWS